MCSNLNWHNFQDALRLGSYVFMLAILKSHIRPILEFGSTVWNTGYLGDMRLLESVQRRWNKHIDGLAELPYTDRLKALNLYSVQGKLLRADLIKCWKIFHNQSAIFPSDLFSPSPGTTTRGHRFKLAKPHIYTLINSLAYLHTTREAELPGYSGGPP